MSYPNETSIIESDGVSVNELRKSSDSCELNGRFGLFLQGLLAFTAFCILILKRLREPVGERRPVKIWCFDTSKQAIGAIIIHFANVFLASAFQGDPCTWYLINFLLDTTLGLLIIWASLKLAQFVGRLRGIARLSFGEYGNPPKFHVWLVQCIIYIFIMLFEKSVIVLLVQLDFWETVRRFILRPIESPKLEAAIVMLIVPLVMNAFMFWVVDNFLMRKRRKAVHITGEEVNVKYFSRPSDLQNSDDEVVLHSLIQNESRDTLLDETEVSIYGKDHIK